MTDIDCPRARTFMTPCIARDGATALAGPLASDPDQTLSCVGCGEHPRSLLLELSERYEPARRYRQTHDPVNCADTLAKMVKAYVEA